MSEEATETPAHPTVKVARDLTEIVNLVGDLEAQAVTLARSHLMPGGAAMVALGNVANMEAWENMHQATERYGRAYTSITDEDPDEAWSAYQLLEFWSEQWRIQHGAEYDPREFRTTIATEANFIRSCLDWAWDNEPHWDDFARDINRARVKLEEILHAGRRIDLSRVECDQCDAHPRLIRLLGTDEDGADDRWKCPNRECRHRFNREEVTRALGRQFIRADAARYVPQADAIAMLKQQGHGERTIRRWLEAPLKHTADQCQECGRTWNPSEYPACPGRMKDGEVCGGFLDKIIKGDPDDVVSGYCEVGSRKVWTWWPDMWSRHRRATARRLARKAKGAGRV